MIALFYRYSFVSNAILYACREIDNDRLNDLAIMCAEMTACCNFLASEWLGVLLTLCCPLSHPGYYAEVLSQVDVQDVSIHNSLAVFTCILIARHCFSLEDFVARVALPSLMKVRTNCYGLLSDNTFYLPGKIFRQWRRPSRRGYASHLPPIAASI